MRMAKEPPLPLEEIYRRHAATVYKFLLSLCRNAHMAEELTQPLREDHGKHGERRDEQNVAYAHKTDVPSLYA